MEIKTRLQILLETVQEDPKRLGCLVIFGLLLFWILRGCIPGLNRNALPPELLDNIQRSSTICISAEDTPPWPGEARQPECGRFNVDMVEEGIVPPSEQAEGVAQAICYRITIENPRWQTMGQTRHEVLWSSRSYSKVAVLQNGKWQTFPDEDKQDEQRWSVYGCPGNYVLE
ncbi:MAG: hypothetical protein AB8I58_13470 [Anaerolineales bacterium]